MADFYWYGIDSFWQNEFNWSYLSGYPSTGADTAYFSSGSVRMLVTTPTSPTVFDLPKSYPTYANVTITLVGSETETEGWTNVGDAWTFTYRPYLTYWNSFLAPVGAPFTLALQGGYAQLMTGSGSSGPMSFSMPESNVSVFSPVSLNYLRFTSDLTSAIAINGAFTTGVVDVAAGAAAVSLTGSLDTYTVGHAGGSTLTLPAATVRVGVSSSGSGNTVFTGTVTAVPGFSPYSPAMIGFGTTGSGRITVPSVGSTGSYGTQASLSGNVTLGTLGGIEVNASGSGSSILVGGGSGRSLTSTSGSSVTFTGDASFNGFISVSGTTNIAAGKTLTVSGVESFGQSFTGTIAGAGGLAQTGTDLLNLSVANTYLGGTTLWQGTTKIGNASALGIGLVSVASTATLQIGSAASGKATLGGKLTLNGGTLRIGG